jgi:hypothetical protein
LDDQGGERRIGAVSSADDAKPPEPSDRDVFLRMGSRIAFGTAVLLVLAFPAWALGIPGIDDGPNPTPYQRAWEMVNTAAVTYVGALLVVWLGGTMVHLAQEPAASERTSRLVSLMACVFWLLFVLRMTQALSL